MARKPVVFISHATADTYLAKSMRKDIRTTGADSFLDAVDIEVGDEIGPRIEKGIARCSELVVLLTPASIQRRWVWIEIGAAWGQKKRIAGVVHGMTIEELLDEPDLPPVISDRNISHLNDFGKYVTQLRARVKRSAT